MGAERDALILFVGDALVGHDVTRIELDLDLVLGFPNLHATTDPGHRDGVAVAVQGHITFDIHRSEEHTSELQSQSNLVCRLLLEKKKHTTPRVAQIELCLQDHQYTYDC